MFYGTKPTSTPPRKPEQKMEYKILLGVSVIHLSESVNDFLALGWEVQGGVHTQIIKGEALWMQAMTKRLSMTSEQKFFGE